MKYLVVINANFSGLQTRFLVWNIYEIIWNCTAVVDVGEEWSSQLIFQFNQLEGRSLKNIRASTGFEPVTSAFFNATFCCGNMLQAFESDSKTCNIVARILLVLVRVTSTPLTFKATSSQNAPRRTENRSRRREVNKQDGGACWRKMKDRLKQLYLELD